MGGDHFTHGTLGKMLENNQCYYTITLKEPSKPN